MQQISKIWCQPDLVDKLAFCLCIRPIRKKKSVLFVCVPESDHKTDPSEKKVCFVGWHVGLTLLQFNCHIMTVLLLTKMLRSSKHSKFVCSHLAYQSLACATMISTEFLIYFLRNLFMQNIRMLFCHI